MIDRRSLLGAAAAGAPLLALPALAAPPRVRLPGFFAELEQRMFAYFWELGRDDNGLVPDRWPTYSACSIAAVGFALSAYLLGVERGWIARTDARRRTLTTLRFFDQAPQGEGEDGVTGHRGFFYHFLDMETGLRFAKCELSSVDSTLLFLGMLHAGQWFDGDDPDEREIRRLATHIVERADWRWFQRGRDDVSMGWHPADGFIERGWTGYNEGKMVALLALGAEQHPVSDAAWPAWCATYPGFWRGEGGTHRLAFAPLFGHQYSECWIDFRGIADAPMRAAGLDYFENGRRATYANRAWCIANPMRWEGYGKQIWGLTACDGPGHFTLRRAGVEREVRGYSARGPESLPDGYDDGTIAPTAALSSIAFAPEICVPAAAAMMKRHGARLYRRYGFADSFNPSVRDRSLNLETGTVDPVHGWVATDHLGIDQGPALLMAANHRSGAVWRTMRRAPAIRRGLRRAGFAGGWLDRTEG